MVLIQNTSWWAIGAGDVATRACLFDDSIVFNSNGTYDHYMDGSTWLESWQAGSPPEGCGTPIAPHDGRGPIPTPMLMEF